MNEAYFRKQEQMNRKKHKTNMFTFSLQLGLFAGLIWGGLRWIAYELHFTIVVPGFILEPYFKHEFLEKPAGGWLGWASFIVLSIIASLIYTLLFKKIPGFLAGIVYGVIWWVVLFIAIGPMLKWMPPITKVNWNSIWTDSCLFLLWGLFIGYTVAIEYNDERVRESVNPTNGNQQAS
ncbi:YqhR family membrane protein [Paenibacillus marinisediminis]